MLKPAFVLCCYLIAIQSSSIFAQSMAGKSIYLGNNATGRIDEIPLETTETKGSAYLADKWQVGNIYLVDKRKIENYPLKYEIAKRQIEIKDGDKTKVLQANHAAMFEWFDTDRGMHVKFINPKNYTFNETQLVGFLEVIIEGEWSLFSRMETEKVKGNYVAALDVGDNTEQIVKKEKLYLVNTNTLVEPAKNKKDFAAQFPGKEDKVLDYIKTNKLGIKSRNDLTAILIFVNGL